MTRLPGLGPKRARKLFDELGIDSLSTLRAAAEGQHLRGLKGFGPKFEASVLSSLAAGIGDRPAQRVLLHRALSIGEAIVDGLRRHPAAMRVELAGSARRQADSVKDLDIIATASDPGALARALGELDLIESASAPNENAARGRTHTGLPVDLRVVEPENFGNLLQHFTGSAAHNVALREASVRRGLHVSEYGIVDDATGETLRCATEEEVYERLGLAYPEPELRENRGELAADFVPPRLISVEDLRGDLHMHTTLSDGRGTLEEMAQAALARGYEYIAITDHSATHGFGNHVTPDELERQIERVAELNERLDGITLLAGTETNILPDGSPDYDDDLLARLGWVIASVHTGFGMPGPEMTKRMVAAIEHPWIDAIGHPTGRKIQSRQPYALDIDEVIAAAARTGHDARDQLRARPPRPQRRPREGRRRGGRDGADRLRRPRRRPPAARALGRRDRAPRMAEPGARRQHAAVAGVRGAAQARASLSPGAMDDCGALRPTMLHSGAARAGWRSWRPTRSTNRRCNAAASSSTRASTCSTATGATASRRPTTRTPTSRRTRGRSTPRGTSGSPRAPTTRRRRATRSCTATFAACTGRA